MLKIALIGCGAAGSIHAKCWQAMGNDIKLVAIADTCREKAENIAMLFERPQLYSTGMELLENEKVDIVDICLPTHLHTVHALRAMQLGMNVFIEVPVCLNATEIELLTQTQNRMGCYVQVGHNVRFQAEYKWLKDMIDSETYGRIVHGVFRRFSPQPSGGWENWHNKRFKSGTAALDVHIHDVDFVRYMMSREPDTVTAEAVRNELGMLQQIFAVYDFGGCIIKTEGGWNFPDTPLCETTFEVKFERATVIYDKEKVLTVYTKTGRKVNPKLNRTRKELKDKDFDMITFGDFYDEITYFVKLVKNEVSEEAVPLEESIESLNLTWHEIGLVGGTRIKDENMEEDYE